MFAFKTPKHKLFFGLFFLHWKVKKNKNKKKNLINQSVHILCVIMKIKEQQKNQ